MSQANLQELTEAKAEADEGRKGKAFNRPRENEAGGKNFREILPVVCRSGSKANLHGP